MRAPTPHLGGVGTETPPSLKPRARSAGFRDCWDPPNAGPRERPGRPSDQHLSGRGAGELLPREFPEIIGNESDGKRRQRERLKAGGEKKGSSQFLTADTLTRTPERETAQQSKSLKEWKV